MNKISGLIIIIFSLFIIGCDSIDLSKVSDDDLKRISEIAIVCNTPYMRLGAECCLDKDQNGICDRDEGEKRPSMEIDEEDTAEPVQEGDKLVCNKPYIQVGTECCLDKDGNSICDYDDEYYAEDEEESEIVEEEETEPSEDPVTEEETEETDLEEDVVEEVETEEAPDESDSACRSNGVGECSVGYYTLRYNERTGQEEIYCENLNYPTYERCDNKDNDCNGVVDNGNPDGGEDCEVEGNGGKTSCVKGTLVCVVPTGASGPNCPDADRDGYSTCDNDCDDNNILKSPGMDELCDQVDNDCDGREDNGFSSKGWYCSVGQGQCQRSGTYICSEDKTDIACNTLPGTPTPETCNTIDDDCNGAIDDNVPEANTACDFQGYSGKKLCRGGAIECVQVWEYEICNGIDDDDDGETDEGTSGGNCGTLYDGWRSYQGKYQCNYGRLLCR